MPLKKLIKAITWALFISCQAISEKKSQGEWQNFAIIFSLANFDENKSFYLHLFQKCVKRLSGLSPQVINQAQLFLGKSINSDSNYKPKQITPKIEKSIDKVPGIPLFPGS